MHSKRIVEMKKERKETERQMIRETVLSGKKKSLKCNTSGRIEKLFVLFVSGHLTKTLFS